MQQLLYGNPDVPEGTGKQFLILYLSSWARTTAVFSYRSHIDSFMIDYKFLIHSFKVLPSKPRIVLLLPSSSYLTDTARQTDAAITKWILPRIWQVAYDEKLEMIDLHSITAEKEALYPDKLHPSVVGAAILAKRLYEFVTTSPDKVDFDIFKLIKEPTTISSFQGYDCADFRFKGHSCKIVKPRRAAKGLPWIWRARFFGVNPQADIALLDRGFHLVYCDVAELYGNREAISVWNAFYKKMHTAGLAEKVCLEGFSRGGVYIYRWGGSESRQSGLHLCRCSGAGSEKLAGWW